MGLFDKWMRTKDADEAVNVVTASDTVYLPIEGKVIALSEIGDGVFSEGILANRGFSDCCPVPPRFAAKCLAEKVMDKRL